MLDPTSLDVTGDRIVATYAFFGDPAEAESRAEALRVEQTIEYPLELIPDDDIRRFVVGQVEAVDQVGDDEVHIAVSYATEVTGYELPQLLNVLWGNSSLLPGIRLVAVEFPDSFLDRFKGPRFGLNGVRQRFNAPRRPLLATALKPIGLSAERIGDLAYQLALGGVDVIKDDHSLANQPFAQFEQRVAACAAAVTRANAQTGNESVYMPSINSPYNDIDRRVRHAVDSGSGGLLLLPGIGSFDLMRAVASDDAIGLPIMSHPALLGSFVTNPHGGIGHDVLFGSLMRLAGADMVVYPNYGGRFSFSQAECRSIAVACQQPLGSIAQAVPTPGGGMTMQRIPEIVDFYEGQVMLLIGGDLHRGDSLTATAAAFRAALEP